MADRWEEMLRLAAFQVLSPAARFLLAVIEQRNDGRYDRTALRLHYIKHLRSSRSSRAEADAAHVRAKAQTLQIKSWSASASWCCARMQMRYCGGSMIRDCSNLHYPQQAAAFDCSAAVQQLPASACAIAASSAQQASFGFDRPTLQTPVSGSSSSTRRAAS